MYHLPVCSLDNALHLGEFEEDETLMWWTTIGFIAALESVYSLPSKGIGWNLSFVSVLFILVEFTTLISMLSLIM